jgi:flagellar biosynthesis regulator FlaF
VVGASGIVIEDGKEQANKIEKEMKGQILNFTLHYGKKNELVLQL